jgi:hypothetical protein
MRWGILAIGLVLCGCQTSPTYVPTPLPEARTLSELEVSLEDVRPLSQAVEIERRSFPPSTFQSFATVVVRGETPKGEFDQEVTVKGQGIISGHKMEHATRWMFDLEAIASDNGLGNSLRRKSHFEVHVDDRHRIVDHSIQFDPSATAQEREILEGFAQLATQLRPTSSAFRQGDTWFRGDIVAKGPNFDTRNEIDTRVVGWTMINNRPALAIVLVAKGFHETEQISHAEGRIFVDIDTGLYVELHYREFGSIDWPTSKLNMDTERYQKIQIEDSEPEGDYSFLKAGYF